MPQLDELTLATYLNDHLAGSVAGLARLKIGAGENDDSGLMLFEALEALSLGFFGRMSLWRILAVVQADLPLRIDFDALATRASRHLADLEGARVAAGLAALSVEARMVPAAPV